MSTDKVNLIDLMNVACPALTHPDKAVFKPSKWLFNGHLQTAAMTKMDSIKGYEVDYSREIVALPDGGTIALDWFPSLEVNPDPNLPIIFIMHGLTGGSHEFYVRSFVKTITDTRHGCRVIVLNNRGCGFSEIVTPKLYSAGHTDDLRFVLQRVRDQFPLTTPLIGVGFSLGSNILVKFAGEEGDRCVLKAAVSVSNPFNVLKTSELLHAGFWSSRTYARVMRNEIIGLFNRHRHMFKDPESDATIDFDFDPDSVARCKNVREFDDLFTRRMFGYASVQDYYRSAGCAPYVGRVRIPLLCVHSLDDPVCLAQSIPLQAIRNNPYVVLATTAAGGHLGWLAAGSGGHRVRPWLVDPVSEFCMAMAQVEAVDSPETCLL
ncbi:Alpha/Beta hydrolase protein [Dimargaris cristalligena]|uniref:Alpha/Beta hydrolase protein n=1 Tax=Dimargaris cristalligena TaxID=215637 RepID=A0A4P9ZNS4_9FUNG|nr:Alpha/Beta hydrolase protein [Dimargaris cristalligena]|eukprot:RKP35074.1 Alpha/Beta hydrolase protein [Dimargaris cristalligena]